jgi:hypothetical protein
MKNINNETKNPMKTGMGNASGHGFARMGTDSESGLKQEESKRTEIGIKRGTHGAKRSLEPMWVREEAGQGGLSRSGVPWGMDGFLKENDTLTRSTRFNPLQPAMIF